MISKDPNLQNKIPELWRPTIIQIVSFIADGLYSKIGQIPNVDHLDDETIDQIKNYVFEYGAQLAHLNQETWSTSVCIWMDDGWEILVDLFTVEEGSSDLVLSAKVVETKIGHSFTVKMVYVP